MSLLDDVSIVVTPNGYKAGELYAVLPVPTEGAELVTNGDFATDSDWTKGTGWTISGGSASCDGTQTSNSFLYQSVLSGITRAKTEITISNYTSGNLTVILGGGGSQEIFLANGTYTFNGTKGSDNTLYIKADASFVGSVDNVSVKEYTSADMDVTRATAATRVDENGLVNYAEIIGGEEVTDGNFPLPNTNWILGGSGSNIPTIGTNDVAINSVDGNSFIQQSGILTSGKYYKITYDVISASATSNVLKLASSFGLGSIPTSVGTQIVYGTAITSTLYIERYTNGVNATITNVSVKEVTRDNVPRIDYTGGGCPHILAEPQRTNLLPYSEDFTSWTTTGSAAVTPNTTISPDGTQNADTLNLLAGSYFYKVLTTGAGTFTLSCYVKVASGTLDFKMQSFGADGAISSGVFTATTNWQRFEFTTTITANSGFYPVQVSGLVGGDFQIWGAQVEEGSYATSYIPTSGSTVTRNQDVFTRDGIGSLINSTEGVLFLEMAKHNGNTVAPVISLNNGTSSQTVALYFFSTDSIAFDVISSSPTVSGISSPYNTDNFNKIALKYKSGDIALWVNGVEVLTKTNAISLTGLNKISFDYGNGTYTFYGKVKQLQVYTTALTDEQLTSLTS